MKKEIGIVLLATNAYFVLGLRFIRRFMHFYEGESNIKFYFFSDQEPTMYLPDNINDNVIFLYNKHTSWVDGTNSKFLNILKLADSSSNYLFYFDADTNIQKPFTEEWFCPKDKFLIGGEHYSNRTTLSNGKGFDRNPKGNSYVPETSNLPYTYHYGAFFGGCITHMITMCTELAEWQRLDQAIHYEPPVNDESYINKYFHYIKPYTVPIEEFEFVVSDKGGLGNTRQMNLNVRPIQDLIRLNRYELWDIQNGKFKTK